MDLLRCLVIRDATVSTETFAGYNEYSLIRADDPASAAPPLHLSSPQRLAEAHQEGRRTQGNTLTHRIYQLHIILYIKYSVRYGGNVCALTEQV